jgi:hypothetical protein
LLLSCFLSTQQRKKDCCPWWNNNYPTGAFIYPTALNVGLNVFEKGRRACETAIGATVLRSLLPEFERLKEVGWKN